MSRKLTNFFFITLFVIQTFSADPNCNIASPDGECIFCKDLYFIKNGVCTALTAHCASGDVVSGMCNSCDPGYNLINGACIPGSGPSSDSSVTSASLQSLSSSFGSSGTSVTQVSTPQPGVGAAGSSITNTTTVTTTTSIKTIPYCSIINANGGCDACQLGYNLISNSCIPILNSQNSSQISQITSTQSSSSQTGNPFLNSQFSGVQPLSAVIPTTATPTTSGSSSSSSQFSSNQFTQLQQPQVVQPVTTSQLSQFNQQSQNQQNFLTQQPVQSTIVQSQPIQTQTTRIVQTTQTTPQTVASPIYQQPQSQQQFQTNQQNSQFQQSNQIQNQVQNQYQQNIQQTTLQQQTPVLQTQYRQDPYCASFSPTGVCIRCSNRYYFASNGTCIPISGNCNTYDDRTGACTSCYQTFVLQNGQCYVQLSSSSQPDPNCKSYANNFCRECYPGYVISNGVCAVGNMLCRTSDTYGNCLSCYPGYVLLNNNCTVTVNSFNNPNCANFSNGVCVRCSQGYYMNGGNCLQVSPLCNTFDQNYGNCLSCYQGYYLVGGSCVVSSQPSTALNCRNFTGGRCVQCSNRFYPLSGVCTPVNDYCNTYSEANGNCTSCYQGFVLQQGACYRVLITGQQQNQQQGGFQPNQGYFFSQDSNPGSLSNTGGYSSTTTTTTITSGGQAVPCLQFDSQGKCISCSNGFNLNNGVCIQMN